MEIENKRKTFEVNEILSSDDQELKNLAMKIKNAAKESYENCNYAEDDYVIDHDLERQVEEINQENMKEHETSRKNFSYFIDPKSTSREDSQLWNQSLDKPHYPYNLADNFKAFCKYKMQEELLLFGLNGNKEENLKEVELKKEDFDKNNNFGNSFSVVNKYLRNQLNI